MRLHNNDNIVILAGLTLSAMLGLAAADAFCDGKNGYYCTCEQKLGTRDRCSSTGAGAVSKYCNCKSKTTCYGSVKTRCKTTRECKTAFSITCQIGCAEGRCTTAENVCGTRWSEAGKSYADGPPMCPLEAGRAGPADWKLPRGWISFHNIMSQASNINDAGKVVKARQNWFRSLMTDELMTTTRSCTDYTRCSSSCLARNSTDKSFAINETDTSRATYCDAALPTKAACEANSTCNFTAAVLPSKPPTTATGQTLSSVYTSSANKYDRFACAVSYPKCIDAGVKSSSQCTSDCIAVSEAISAYEQGCQSAYEHALNQTNGDVSKVGFECKTLATIEGPNNCDGTAGGKAGVWCVKGQGAGFTTGGWKRDCDYICTGNEPPPPLPPQSPSDSEVKKSVTWPPWVGILIAVVVAAAAIFACFYFKSAKIKTGESMYAASSNQ